jgi:hypothetical protein
MAPFKTLFQISLLRVLSIAFIALGCATTLSAQTLAWNANTETNLAGYRVQYGTVSGSPTSTLDVGRATSWTITGLTAGRTYYLRVVAYNTSGQTSTPSAQVSYTVPSTTTSPTLTSVSPASGPTTGGTTITLIGTNFVSGATVRVGGVAATNVVFSSSTQMTARTPAGTAGAKDVVVTNPNGAAATRSGAFTYTTTSTTLTATSVSPLSGPTTGGTTITVAGTGFVSGATVSIGGTLATNVTYVSSTRLTARTPAKAAGGYSVVVRNPNGQVANTPVGFTYTSTSTGTLTATSVSPLSGPTTGGTTITVNGTGFVSGATISIGGTAATGVTFVSSTRLTARTPAKAAGGYVVQVRNPNGQTANTPTGFTYTSSTTSTAPRADTVSPGSGPTTGGTLITVNGANFVSGATVKVGGKLATSVTFVSSTRLTARTPAMPVGGYPVIVTNPNGQWDNTSSGFLYVSGTTAAAETTSAASLAAETTLYLAEGVESDQMHTQLAIANPDAADARVQMTFMTAEGATVERSVDVPARTRRTLDLREVPELAGQSFSAEITSDRAVAVDRRVSLDPAGRATTVATAVPEASPTWYFAEGPTAAPFEQFYLVQNPGDAATQVQVSYLPPGGAEPVVRTHTVAAHSRATIWVDRDAPELAATRVGAEIASLDGAPIVVERTVYTTQPGSAQARSAVTHAGVTAVEGPDAERGPGGARWLVADAVPGASAQGTSSVVVANQGAATDVTVTLLFEDGPEASATFAIEAGARFDVPLAAAFPQAAGRRFSVLIEALDPAAALVVDREAVRPGATGTTATGSTAARLP